MTAETDIAAIDDGGANTAAEVRTALTSVLARADSSIEGIEPTAWYDPSDAANYTLDSSRVSQLDDLSGNGHHATQATSGSRPFIVTQGGIDWLDFSGGNYFLSSGGPGATLGGRTIFAVVYLPGSHTSARRVFIESYAQYFGGSMEIDASNRLTVHTNDGGLKSTSEVATFPVTSVQVVVQTIWGSTAVRAYRGITERANTSMGSVATASQTGFRLGTYRDTNDRWYNGYLGEVLIIDRPLDQVERLFVTGYLADKWG